MRQLYLLLEAFTIMHFYEAVAAAEDSSTKHISFGIVKDSSGYSEIIISTLRAIMDYFEVETDLKIPYTIDYIDMHRPMVQQMKGACWQGMVNLEVIFSATSCGVTKRLAMETEALGVPHFVVNVARCKFRNSSILLDHNPGAAVIEAITDVISIRRHTADIVVLHDSDYEKNPIVRRLLRELGQTEVRYSYMMLDPNITRMTQRIEWVRRGNKELCILVLAELGFFKSILDKMYQRHLLDPTITYLIVNDGWLAMSPEIEKPQKVNYDIDIEMLVLKRRLSHHFNNLLHSIHHNEKNYTSVFQNRIVPFLGREDIFVIAAASSVVQCVKHLNLEKCVPHHHLRAGNNTVYSFIKSNMHSSGVLADGLAYDILRNVPIDSKSETFKLLAQWVSGANPRFRYLQSETKLLFENQTIRLALPFNPPYTISMGTDNPVLKVGAVNKLFEYLTRHLKFNYDVLRPQDNEWGVRISENNWNGAIDMLLQRNADLIPFLAITQGRTRVLDFSEPVMITASAILIQKPKEPPRTFIFLRPFNIKVWILIILSIPFVGKILHFFTVQSAKYAAQDPNAKPKGGLHQLSNCVWYTYGAILQQGGAHLPQTVSARIVVGTWWVFVVVTMATYSGNMIAFLTFPEADWIVTSIQDLAKKEYVTVIIQQGTSLQQEIFESPMETLKIIHQRILKGQSAFVVLNMTAMLPLVKSGKAALIEDIYVLSDIINSHWTETRSCNEYALVPNKFLEIYLAIASRKGSPYIQDINRLIQSLWHGGLMQHWANYYSQLNQECNFIPAVLHGGRKDVNLTDLQGAFYMLFLGLLISLTIIIAEIAWKKYITYKGDRCLI